MLLLGVTEDKGWLTATFNLTYRVGWEQIQKGVGTAYRFFKKTEILVDDKPVSVTSGEDIMKLKEAGSMTIRGLSTIIKVPLMITFYNQLQTVNVALPAQNEEFRNTDYQKFNMSLGQYMDSIELAMYR